MKKFARHDWEKYFPFTSPRQEQVDAINFALDAYINQDKRFVICEVGTGGGKSAIGLTVARAVHNHYSGNSDYHPGSYFLTTQKILQAQYTKDFGVPRGNMLSLKSSSNYKCNGVSKGETCASGQRIMHGSTALDKGTPGWKNCMFDCAYKRARRDFINGKEGVTNFAYFLASTQYTDKLKPRNCLIVDEAHNSSLALSKFIEITLTEKFAYETLKLRLPQAATQAQVVKWIKDVYNPKLKRYVEHVEGVLERYQGLKNKLKEFGKYARLFEQLDKHTCQIARFLTLYNAKNWVMNEVPAYGKAGAKIEFKPIDVAPFSEEFLFNKGKKVLLMSATILNKDGFCELLGIDPKDAAFISIPSPFPAENKPILFSPAGSMAARSINETLPNVAAMVKEILAAHPKDKGIIHAHSYKIAKYIREHVKSSRILIHGSDNRDEILEKHMSSKKSTVLLSPSMSEGIDLKDDASRFQILCKVPYPYLGDRLVKKRMHKWKWWYGLQTAKLIVQSVGRSIRNKDDFAVTYILDGDWQRFYDREHDSFPQDFKDSLQ